MELRKLRSEKLTLRAKLNEERTVKIREEVEEIEKNKNYVTKMFKALKTVKRKDSKKPLLVDSEDGVTTSGEEQVKLITKYFKDFFNQKNSKELLNVKTSQHHRLHVNTIGALQSTHLHLKSSQKDQSQNFNNTTQHSTAQYTSC